MMNENKIRRLVLKFKKDPFDLILIEPKKYCKMCLFKNPRENSSDCYFFACYNDKKECQYYFKER